MDSGDARNHSCGIMLQRYESAACYRNPGFRVMLTPVTIVRVLVVDPTWTKYVLVTPGIADFALDEITQTGSSREVTG